jgi:hypothetical protein
MTRTQWCAFAVSPPPDAKKGWVDYSWNKTGRPAPPPPPQHGPPHPYQPNLHLSSTEAMASLPPPFFATSPLLEWVAHTDVLLLQDEPNKGRDFFACTKPREEQCNFFQWCDAVSIGKGSAFPGQGWKNPVLFIKKPVVFYGFLGFFGLFFIYLLLIECRFYFFLNYS